MVIASRLQRHQSPVPQTQCHFIPTVYGTDTDERSTKLLHKHPLDTVNDSRRSRQAELEILPTVQGKR